MSEIQSVLEKIFKETLKDVDTIASYQHYLVFGEIKVIKKENEKC